MLNATGVLPSVSTEGEFDPYGAGHDAAGILSAAMTIYREKGFEHGYQRAMGDLLASLVPATERYLRNRDLQGLDARRLIYGYIEFLEAHIQRASSEASYMTGGLGI